MTNYIDFIQGVPLFQGLNNRQLKKLAGRFIPRSFKAGEKIVVQGKGGAGMFVITSGRAEVVLETSDTVEAVVNTFGPQDFFGEIALLDDGPRTASVVAKDKTDCARSASPTVATYLSTTSIVVAVLLRLGRSRSGGGC